MLLPLAATFEANAILVLFLLVGLFGLILGFFTVRGSGITNHPWEGHSGAPGARLPDEFHQFADRQVHDADMRRAAPDDMTLDEANRRLAAEARARKEAQEATRAAGGPSRG
jgi:hypothetical protein